MSSVKITSHANLRLKQRTELYKKRFISNSSLAYKNGLKIDEVEEYNLRRYFYVRGRNIVKKYYKGYIYIFNKNSKRLITLFAIENKENLKKLETIWLEKRKKNEKD